jgi:beta-N-acetylhexosaminidase
VDATLAQLEATELFPFRQALVEGCPAVLVAHVRYPALDPDLPASLSPGVITGLLRRRLAFDGLVLSDDLEMRAVAHGWGVAGAATRFLTAGGDLALVCRDAAAWTGAAEAIRHAADAGRVDLESARLRRVTLRDRVRTSGPPPPSSTIGCPEHRALAEEVRRRSSS